MIPQGYITRARQFVDRHKLALHLDGARAANAAVAQNIALVDVASPFDSVSLCLSKGLGAPIGSVLCGQRVFIDEARRTRKMLGGGMRQAGVIAAAAIYALENNIERLGEDHANASYLAACLARIGGEEIVVFDVQTNMVFVQLDAWALQSLTEYLYKSQIIFVDNLPEDGIAERKKQVTRLVLHKDISREDIDTTTSLVEQFFDGRRD